MLYTPLTKKAMEICVKAHEGQLDKAGMAYIIHPIVVADHVEGEYATCVALLHDVVEDTDITLEELAELGMPSEVVEAVALMTHQPEDTYMEYVAKIKANPLARTTKLADLAHNSDLGRLDEIRPKDIKRAEKYKNARDFLLSE